MPHFFTCSLGHQWEATTDAALSTDDVDLACPICGSPDQTPPPRRMLGAAAGQLGARAESASTDGRLQLPVVPGFEILAELGKGGMGVVYQARQVRLQRLVALKMIKRGAFASVEELQRFQAEAEAAARLEHPHIVSVYEAGDFEGQPYFCMEFMAGGSLARQLAVGPSDPNSAAAQVCQIAGAVHAAHKAGVVHRDLKPANILLSGDGTVKVSDFGLAKRLDVDEGQTGTGAILGTPSYMAPEQASGRPEEIGPPADVYGLGAVLYEMLTGRPPFKASNRLETLEQVRSLEPVAPRQLQPRVPRDLETICLKCLHKEPSKRYGSAKLLAEDLRRFSDKVPILARPVGLVERTWRWCRRKPAVAGLAAAVVLLLVGGTIASTFAAWQINKRAKAEKEANAKASRRLRDVLDATEQHFTTLAMNKELKAEGLETLRQKLLEGARDFCERYAKEESDDPEVRYQQARAYANLATIATELGHLDEAERAFHQAVPLFQELSAAFPNDPRFQRRVGMLHGCQANIFADKGNPQGALAEYAAALQIFERLNEAYPQDTTYLFDLALCHEGRGNLLRHAASPKATIQAYQASLSFRQRIVDVSPDNLDYQRALASSHFNLGQMAMENGELSLAETEFKKDLEITARLARIEPAAPENQSGLVQTHGALGDVYQKMKVPVRAESAFKEAIRIGRELVQKHPLVPKYQTRLAVALFHFAHLYRQLNCLADEERLLREAYSVLEPLTAKHPSLVIERGLLGAVTCNLAGAVGDLNRLEEAVSWQDKSIAVFEALLQAAPEDPGSRDYLMRATAGRALWTARLGRPDDAIKFMKRSLELDVKDSQIEILAAVAQKGAHQSVTAVADRLLGKPRLTPQYLFQLARVYGYATNAAEGDTTLSPTDRVACKRTYSEKALSLLQKAASAAPKHTASLVDAIRADSAFSKLLLQDDYREWLKKLQPNIK